MLYSDGIWIWTTAIGTGIGVIIAIVLFIKGQSDGKELGEIFKIAGPTLVTTVVIGVYVGTLATKYLPPREYEFPGLVNADVIEPQDIRAGRHCLHDDGTGLKHPAIAAWFDHYGQSFGARQNFTLEGVRMGPVITEGRLKGLHVYSVHYNYRERDKDSHILKLKVKRKEYFVRGTDCAANFRGTESGFFSIFS
ncbi:MAG: hypothetical protein J4F41_04835 [Alphaproteobacteria bacterium]|nr:hypothetical protein [Alphaproteobacteria bacterium]